MYPVRTSAKALIINENKLLAVKKEEGGNPYYILPGGGQERFEKLTDALIRECREEVNAEIEIEDLVLVRDYISRNHEFSDIDEECHQVEFMFLCRALNPDEVGVGAEPDTGQTGVEWLDLNRKGDYLLYPKALWDIIDDIKVRGHKVYMGDVN
jgi:ADP-ribose pyrophosphatase YjhB (NUDIX family)